MKLNMHSRFEEEFKKMIFNKSSTEKNCTYIHYSGQFNSIRDVKDFFPFNDPSTFQGKEIFNKEYFSSQISLSNNLSFICEINNIDINKFLEEHGLIEDFNSNKSKKRKEIQIDTYNKIMFYLYLKTNPIYLISFNLYSIINSMETSEVDKIKDYFKKNPMIYFADSFQRNIIKEGIFKYFLVLYDGNMHKIFDNSDEFKDFLLN